MASNSRLYTFTNDKIVSPVKVEIELNNLVNNWNQHEQGLIAHTAMALNVSVKTSSGSYDVTPLDMVVVINKGTGAATQVNLPASPSTGRLIIIKDGKGDAGSNNITVSGNGKNIDGSGTNVISTNSQARQYIYNSSQWNVISVS